MESKKIDPREVAKMKIIQQIRPNSKSQRRRRTKSTPTGVTSPGRNQSFVETGTTKRNLSTSCRSKREPACNSVSPHPISKNGIPRSSSTVSANKSNKNKQAKPETKMIKFVNATEMPIPARMHRHQRTSSFCLRKKVDNELGYEGRRHHRHSWQERRQKEYFGEASSDGD